MTFQYASEPVQIQRIIIHFVLVVIPEILETEWKDGIRFDLISYLKSLQRIILQNIVPCPILYM